MDWLLGKSTRNHGFYNDIFRAFLEIFPKTPMITTAACFAALMVFGIFPEIHNDWGIWDLKCSHEMAVRAVKSRRFVDTPVWFHDFLLKYMKSIFLAVRTKNTHEINICWLLNHNRIPFFCSILGGWITIFLILNHQDQRSDVRGFLGRLYTSRSYEFFQDITPISLDWWLVEASKMTSTKQKDRNPLSLASNLSLACLTTVFHCVSVVLNPFELLETTVMCFLAKPSWPPFLKALGCWWFPRWSWHRGCWRRSPAGRCRSWAFWAVPCATSAWPWAMDPWRRDRCRPGVTWGDLVPPQRVGEIGLVQ